MEIVSSEKLYGVPIFKNWNASATFVRQPKCIWPRVGGDGIGPMVLRVYDHGTCPVLEVSNASLSDAILKVSIDAAK